MVIDGFFKRGRHNLVTPNLILIIDDILAGIDVT